MKILRRTNKNYDINANLHERLDSGSHPRRKNTTLPLLSSCWTLWLESLSRSSRTLRPCIRRLNWCSHSLKIITVIQAFEFVAYTMPRFSISTPLKHLSLINLPMIMGSSFSEPLALQHRVTVTRDFTIFLPLFRTVDRVLFGGKCSIRDRISDFAACTSSIYKIPLSPVNA